MKLGCMLVDAKQAVRTVQTKNQDEHYQHMHTQFASLVEKVKEANYKKRMQF